MCRITELLDGGIPSRFSNPAQIQPSCQMDSCAELNLTLLGWGGSSGRTFKGAARRKQNSGVILSGLGASADNEEHDSPLCLCFLFDTEALHWKKLIMYQITKSGFL